MIVNTWFTPPVSTAQHSNTTGIQNNPTSSLFANTLRNSAISSGNDELDAMFDAAGRKFNLSPDLLKAVAKVESNFKADVVSRAGAMGIMQLMPGTARYLGVDDAFDPAQNIMGGARYLREQLDRFDGDVKLALAAYNAGPGAVRKHGGIPPFRETQAYVPKVLGHLGMGDGEVTADMVAYNGFGGASGLSEGIHNINGVNVKVSLPSEVSESKSDFNFNDALAQILFIKLMEMQMQMSSPGNNENRGIVF